VTPFHTGRIIFQAGGADVFHAIRPGSAMPAFDRGFVGNTLEAVIEFQALRFKVTNMHAVCITVTILLVMSFSFTVHFFLPDLDCDDEHKSLRDTAGFGPGFCRKHDRAHVPLKGYIATNVPEEIRACLQCKGLIVQGK
jgi:hypothetical protein